MPYLLARPGILVAEAAADLGVSERQLREDLELLWVCGLPGYGPGDLIDMAFDGDRVTITYDAGIDRPLRLTQDEALALVVALRMLAEVPGAHDRDAVERALAKIESAAGDAASGLPVAANGCTARRRTGWPNCRARYSAATHCGSPTTPRPATRSPSGWSTRCGCWWSAGGATWRPGAAGPRRCGCSGSTGSTAAPSWTSRRPRRQTPSRTDVSAGIFTPSEELPLITLRIGRWARWITEYYPCERVVEESPSGGWSRCAPPTWPGPAGWCSAWARTCTWSPRPSWPRRSGPRRGARWPRTTRVTRHGDDQASHVYHRRLRPIGCEREVGLWIVLGVVVLAVVLLLGGGRGRGRARAAAAAGRRAGQAARRAGRAAASEDRRDAGRSTGGAGARRRRRRPGRSARPTEPPESASHDGCGPGVDAAWADRDRPQVAPAQVPLRGART